jgi:hypothetical protein
METTMAEYSIATILRCALADLEGIMPVFDPEHVHPGWETLAELRSIVDSEERMEAVDRYDPATQIVIVWSIDDVLERRPDLTKEQAKDVLDMVIRRHDCNFGVSWENLDYCAEELFGDKPPDNPD